MSNRPELPHRGRRTGADEVVDALVRRYRNVVYTIAWRQLRGDVPQAQAVAALVFDLMMRESRSLHQRVEVGSWLFVRACKEAAALKPLEPAGAQSSATEGAARVSRSPALAADWENLRSILDECICELREPERTVIVLRFFEELSIAKVAVRLRVEESLVRQRVNRALEKLSRRLARRGVTSTASALGLALSNQTLKTPPPHFDAVLDATLAAAPRPDAQPRRADARPLQFVVKMGAIAALVVAGVTGVLLQRQANLSLRAEIERLDQENGQLALQLARRPQSALAARDAAFPAQRSDRSAETIVMRSDLDRTYAALFRALALSPATLDAFKTLLVAKQQAEDDTLALARSRRHHLTPAEREALFSVVTADISHGIRRLLGLADFSRYDGYEQTLPHREELRLFAETLRHTASPLNDEQMDQLVNLSVAEGWLNPSSAPHSRASAFGAALQEAAPFLSPPQLSALRQFRAAQMARQEMNELARQLATTARLAHVRPVSADESGASGATTARGRPTARGTEAAK